MLSLETYFVVVYSLAPILSRSLKMDHMARKLQLQIPTPCHENSEKMTQSEKGRFCAAIKNKSSISVYRD